MSKNDKRVKYTKQAIHDAVLELLKTKSIDSMSVKEICELADVNRGTFYLHYGQPRDVLSEIEDQFINENRAFFNNYWDKQHDLNSISDIFSYFLNNQNNSNVLLGTNGNSFLNRIIEMERERVVEEWNKEYPAYSKEKLNYLYDYVIQGSMKLVLNWINDNKGISVEELTNRLDCLGHHALLAAGEFNDLN